MIFSISSATAQWTYSVFLLVLGVMIPPTAYITKRFKIKTILITALILFIIGSVLCFLSASFEILIVGRILEAMGTGILMPIGQILIFRVMPEEKMGLFHGTDGISCWYCACNGTDIRRNHNRFIWLESYF